MAMTVCKETLRIVFWLTGTYFQRWAVRSITLPLREWKSGNLPLFHSREWKSDRPSTLPLFNSSAIGRCLGRCFLYTKEWKSDHSSTLSLFHSREWKSDRHNLKSARRVQDWRWQKSGTLLSISISNCPSLVKIYCSNFGGKKCVIEHFGGDIRLF